MRTGYSPGAWLDEWYQVMLFNWLPVVILVGLMICGVVWHEGIISFWLAFVLFAGVGSAIGVVGSRWEKRQEKIATGWPWYIVCGIIGAAVAVLLGSAAAAHWFEAVGNILYSVASGAGVLAVACLGGKKGFLRANVGFTSRN